MPEHTTAYIGLGSNLGDRRSTLESALRMLAETPDVEVVAVSDTTESAPLGRAAQNNYLNSVARIETTTDAPELH